MSDWRQRFWLRSRSQRCPLQRNNVKRTSRRSLTPKQRRAAAGMATADQDLKMCPGNITVSHAARLFVEGFEDKVHFHMWKKAFHCVRFCFVEFSTHKNRVGSKSAEVVFSGIPKTELSKLINMPLKCKWATSLWTLDMVRVLTNILINNNSNVKIQRHRMKTWP